MPKKNEITLDGSVSRIGDHILVALTQQETADLLDALFEVLSPELRDNALDRLQPDTRRTVRHILYPPKAAGDAKAGCRFAPYKAQKKRHPVDYRQS